MSIGHSGPEREFSDREWAVTQFSYEKKIRFTVRARRLWLKPVPDVVPSLQFFGSIAR